MQIVIELTLPLQTAASSSLPFVKKEMAGRSKLESAVYAYGSSRQNSQHLSALAGVPINRYTVKQRSLGLHVGLCDGDSH